MKCCGKIVIRVEVDSVLRIHPKGQVLDSPGFELSADTAMNTCIQVLNVLQPVNPTIWQRWFRDMSIRERVDSSGQLLVCARDRHSLWTTTLFYGQELRLVLFEAMFLGAVDLAIQNEVVSACLAWLLTMGLAMARVELGRRNIASSTFVDLAFLT
jgi:hypothetical protein